MLRMHAETERKFRRKDAFLSVLFTLILSSGIADAKPDNFGDMLQNAFGLGYMITEAPSIHPKDIPTSKRISPPSVSPTILLSDEPTLEQSREPSMTPSLAPTSLSNYIYSIINIARTQTLATTHGPSSPSPSSTLSLQPSKSQTVISTTSPSMSPSWAPSSCEDEPGWLFTDSPKMGCPELEPDPLVLCKAVQGAGVVYNGKSVMDACCFCGGGTHVEATSSASPSSQRIQPSSALPTVRPSDQPSLSNIPIVAPSGQPSNSIHPSSLPPETSSINTNLPFSHDSIIVIPSLKALLNESQRASFENGNFNRAEKQCGSVNDFQIDSVTITSQHLAAVKSELVIYFTTKGKFTTTISSKRHKNEQNIAKCLESVYSQVVDNIVGATDAAIDNSEDSASRGQWQSQMPVIIMGIVITSLLVVIALLWMKVSNRSSRRNTDDESMVAAADFNCDDLDLEDASETRNRDTASTSKESLNSSQTNTSRSSMTSTTRPISNLTSDAHKKIAEKVELCGDGARNFSTSDTHASRYEHSGVYPIVEELDNMLSPRMYHQREKDDNTSPHQNIKTKSEDVLSALPATGDGSNPNATMSDAEKNKVERSQTSDAVIQITEKNSNETMSNTGTNIVMQTRTSDAVMQSSCAFKQEQTSESSDQMSEYDMSSTLDSAMSTLSPRTEAISSNECKNNVSREEITEYDYVGPTCQSSKMCGLSSLLRREFTEEEETDHPILLLQSSSFSTSGSMSYSSSDADEKVPDVFSHNPFAQDAKIKDTRTLHSSESTSMDLDRYTEFCHRTYTNNTERDDTNHLCSNENTKSYLDKYSCSLYGQTHSTDQPFYPIDNTSICNTEVNDERYLNACSPETTEKESGNNDKYTCSASGAGVNEILDAPSLVKPPTYPPGTRPEERTNTHLENDKYGICTTQEYCERNMDNYANTSMLEEI